MSTPLKFLARTLFALLVTIAAGFPPAFAQGPAPADTPTNKPIVKTSTEEGEETAYAVESESRSERIYPSNYGQAGIFRLRSAESLPEGAVTFGIGGEFYSLSNVDPAVANGPASTIAESLFVGYSPTKNLTVAAMRRSSSTTFGNPSQLIASLGDFNLSGMYSFPLNDSLAIAPIADILIASNFNDLAPSGSTLSAGFGAAVTMSLQPLPLFLHANLLYHMPQIRSGHPVDGPQGFYNFSRFDTMTAILGAELKLGDFIPFLEYNDSFNLGSGLSFFDNPSKISIGTRITPISNKSLAVLIGTDIGIGRGLVPGVPYSPGYQVIGQLSYTFGLSSSERKHYKTTSDVNIVNRKFVIRKNINFKSGSAELDPASTGLLDQIATVIKDNKVKKLLIVGHTDSSANEDYNTKLSLARANTVKAYLVKAGVADDALMTQGYGQRKPKAPNTTEEGRALNRRVEFYIID